MTNLISPLFLVIFFSSPIAIGQSVTDVPPALIQSDLTQDKCGKFLEEERIRSPQYALYMTWLQGFISGYNWYAPWDKQAPMRNIAQGNDITEWGAWIKNYCTAHPFDSFFNATQGLMKQFGALDPIKDRNRWK